MDGLRHRGLATLAVVLLWAGLYLPGLGTPEWKGEEGRRVMPAVTMLETGDWLVPMVHGREYLAKPPLVNWIVAGSFAVTGRRDEWAARLPSALFVLAFVVLLVALPCDWLPLPARVLGAIVFLTNVSILEKGRLIEIEACYVAMTGWATWWWLNRQMAGASRWVRWLPVGVVLGLGILLKGPFLVGFFYLAAIPVLHATRVRPDEEPPADDVGRRSRGVVRELLRIEHLAAVAVMGGIVLAWLCVAKPDTSSALGDEGAVGELFDRLSLAPRNLAGWGPAIGKSLLNFLPWLFYVPLLWFPSTLARMPAEHRPLFRALRCGLVLGFVAMNVMPGTMARYTLPTFPLASLLVGWAISLSVPSKWAALGGRWCLVVVAVLLAAVSGALIGQLEVTPFRVAAALATLGGAVWLVANRRHLGRPLPDCIAWSLTAVVAIVHVDLYAMPLAHLWEKHRPAAAEIDRLVPPGETVYAYDPEYRAFYSYVEHPLVYALAPEEVGPRVRYLVLEQRHLEMLQNQPHVAARHPRVLHRLSERIDGAYHVVELEPVDVARDDVRTRRE